MKKETSFNFGDDSIAQSYDTFLVPSLFVPWAKTIVNSIRPCETLHVLDIACGTGVVTKELIEAVGENGKISALDLNKQMLNLQNQLQ